jgi:prevent-host-death family protein
MRTISVTQLRSRTGYWVRRAAKTPILITKRGVPIAALQPLREAESVQPFFKGRDWTKLPKINFDSTLIISEERDGR